MENTLENKKLFTAQYYGQEIAMCEIVHGRLDLCKVGNYPASPGSQCLKFLELKPLSKISDEDAKELLRLKLFRGKIDLSDIISINVEIGKDIHRINAVAINGIIKHKRWNDFTEGVFISEDIITDFLLIDYLRSKGYALPYMGLSVEDMISYGWIKLKTEN